MAQVKAPVRMNSFDSEDLLAAMSLLSEMKRCVVDLAAMLACCGRQLPSSRLSQALPLLFLRTVARQVVAGKPHLVPSLQVIGVHGAQAVVHHVVLSSHHRQPPCNHSFPLLSAERSGHLVDVVVRLISSPEKKQP
jgi:hypothetical protein